LFRRLASSLSSREIYQKSLAASHVMRQMKGNRSQAARQLDVDRSTLIGKLKKLGLGGCGERRGRGVAGRLPDRDRDRDHDHDHDRDRDHDHDRDHDRDRNGSMA
jgi:ABC-type Zn2+ transport system substrate-binding protein/surface adhesin